MTFHPLQQVSHQQRVQMPFVHILQITARALVARQVKDKCLRLAFVYSHKDCYEFQFGLYTKDMTNFKIYRYYASMAKRRRGA